MNIFSTWGEASVEILVNYEGNRFLIHEGKRYEVYRNLWANSNYETKSITFLLGSSSMNTLSRCALLNESLSTKHFIIIKLFTRSAVS
jgi:hypothetical protein